MRQIKILTGLLTGIIILTGCELSIDEKSKTSSNSLFEKLPSDSTGFVFTNTLTENQYFNLFKWKYIYNGAGVATGDINNDGLVDIYIVGNKQPNKLFLNQGEFKFKDITSQAGAAAMGGYKTGVSIVDINGDGWQDIFVCRDADQNPGFRNNLVFINNRDNTFSQKNDELNLLDQSFTTQALFIDYDNDTDLDIVLLNHPDDFDKSLKMRVKRNADGSVYKDHSPTSPFTNIKIYRNDIDSFTEVTSNLGIDHQSFGLGGIVADFNQDGWMDFFVANDFLEPDFIFINQNGKGFKEDAKSYISHFSQNSMGVDYQDLNNDGYGDLVVLDMLAESNQRQKSFATGMTINQYNIWLKNGYGSQIMRNMLHLGGDKRFSEVGMLAGIEKTDWSWSPVIEDFNLDGEPDLFISNGIKKDMSDKDFIVYLSDSMSRARREGIEALTANNYQNWLKLIPSTPLPNKLFLSNGTLKFSNISTDSSGFSDSTFTQGVATADLNNDGLPDLVLNNSDQPATIYKNSAGKDKNFIKIRLKGPGRNTFGYGSRISIYSGRKAQTKFVHANSGYLSSSHPATIFGLPGKSTIDSLVVTWPGREHQVFRQVNTGELNLLTYDKAQIVFDYDENTVKDYTIASGLLSESFTHQDSDVDLFRIDPLLIKSFNHRGPALTVGDLNNDGKDDFFTGGGIGQASAIFLHKDSGYNRIDQPALEKDKDFNDVSATILDSDGDGDNDLYVISGGYKIDDRSYEDRLYVNDGKGNFTRKTISDSNYGGGVATSADIDNDGDDDLFTGHMLHSDDIYTAPPAFVLINTEDGFKEKELPVEGKITSAVWVDLNGDELLDLVVAGYWMNPSVLIQAENYVFENKTSEYGLDGFEGFWNTLEVADINNDGQPELLAGNEGLNIPFDIEREKPLKLYIEDFDDNGALEGIVSYYRSGKEWPYARRETLGKQLPMINKTYTNYLSYAKATVEEVLAPAALIKAKQFYIRETRSGVFSLDSGKFNFYPFPEIIQSAPVFTIERISDEEFLMAGNFRYNEVEIGPYDASHGFIWNSSTSEVERLMGNEFSGEIRRVKNIEMNSDQYLLVSVNNGELRLIKRNK